MLVILLGVLAATAQQAPRNAVSIRRNRDTLRVLN